MRRVYLVTKRVILQKWKAWKTPAVKKWVQDMLALVANERIPLC